jgi:hypothetical protein
MGIRGPLAAALATLIAIAPAIAAPALATTTGSADSAAASAAVAAAPKVVIVVGAVQGSTTSYRAKGDQLYAEAIKYTPNVIKLYSPNATWAKVKAAAQGASVFIYLGHGYGFPSPYRPILSGDVQDGMGINGTGGIDDNDLKYYGESLIASDIRFAKNAVVLLSGLCYAAGSSESGAPAPSIPVAKERIDNFASGWLRAGARVVISDTWVSSVAYDIAKIFTADLSFSQVWNGAPNHNASEQAFIPARNPQYDARVDPESGFYRSFVGALNLRTTDVIAGAAAASTAATTDTLAPELWSVDGPTSLTPNSDGQADRLNLLARYSESVNWSAELKNAGGDVVRSQSGSGHQPNLTWDLNVSGAPAPVGAYTWHLHATDAAGNAAADASGPFTIANQATPGTGVLSFAPTTPTMIKSGTISFAIKFASPVTGFTAADLTRTGTAPGCVIGAPVGSGADYTIALTGCTTGTVALYLNSGTVTDAALHVGPAGPIATAKVTIDASAPKVVAPKLYLRGGLALEGASATQRLLAYMKWSATDAGAGVANYDIDRSYDGAAFTRLVSASTLTTLTFIMNQGHSYRFRVRARDLSGNLGAWVYTSTWRGSLPQNSSASVVYTGAWGTSSDANASGGTVRSASDAGASASLTFTGRAVGWVTTLRPDAGMVQVWTDGVLVATVDTHADAITYRQVVFSKSWTTSGSHTIKLVVVGTAGHPLGIVDAFEVVN